MTRRFECVEDGAAKFWEVTLDGAAMTVTYGKLGTSGQSKTKTFASASDARSEADKLVREKTKKGYVEQAAPSSATEAGVSVGDELAVLRSPEATELRDAIGELRVLAAGEEPEILDGFRLDATNGEGWTSVFEGIEWLFEEADGGAIGRYRDETRCVVYLDNEGQFRLSPTLIDHLAWKDYDGEHAAELKALAKKHGLPAPLAKAAREKAVKGILTPEARLAEHKKSAAKAAPEPTKDKGPGSRPTKADPKAGKAPAAAKGPRPLCRLIQVTVWPDGTLYTLSGEDFGGAFGEQVTRNVAFRFDEASSSFALLPKQPVGPHGEALDHWRCFSFAPERCLENDAWLERGGVEITTGMASGFTTHRLRDGSWLIQAGDGPSVLRYANGALSELVPLPERRHADHMVELADGRVMLAQGKVNYAEQTSTLVLDVARRTIAQGPPLPGQHGLFGADGRGRAYLLHGYLDNAEHPATLSVFEGSAWRSRPAPRALYDATWGNLYVPVCALASGHVLLHASRTMALATLDLDTGELTAAGALATNMSAARGVLLRDGRVLFLGGTLYNNIDAEPEIWDPATRTARCLSGYDKEAAKQVSALAKYRAKKGY